ncbi:protein kinase, partial [bacterium]|nr:protein kinase [bacterium]
MGVVYKAEDTKLKRTVALKFLPLHATAGNDEKARFEHEAQAAAALDHPNICTVYEINEADGQTFIAMAYVEGHSLQDVVGGQNLVPLPDILNYATQIAEGLQAAHEKEIVHRDIKPANILITEKGHVRITDFGLAKLAGRTQITKEGTSMGTVAYMSPEQTQGSEVDHRTDIWALGAVLFEMITGRQPFEGDYEQAVMYSIMNENPEPPTALRTGVPMELERIIQKCLAKKPNERYQNVSDILVDLKGLEKSLEFGISKTQKSVAGAMQTGRSQRIASAKKWLMVGIPTLLVSFGLAAYQFLRNDEPTTALSNKKSIAVLPFENLSADKENEYFSDGITEDIISRISKISDLRVISRTSVMQYKKSNKTIKQIADELNVATILEGSVRRSDNQVRIVAQLIDAKNDENLWSQTYDRELKQIFVIQSEVAHQIGKALQARLSPQEAQLMARQPTEDLEAYTLYLKSRHHFLKYTEEGFRVGLDLAQQAIERDPGYAIAYAGLAEAYYRAASLYVSSSEALPKAKEAALKAFELDETVVQACVALAVVTYRYDYNWDDAEKLFKRALQLNPGDATAHEEYGSNFLMSQGRFVEAIAQLKHALNLDPYSAAINMKLQMTYYYQGEYQLSVQQADYILSLNPDYAASHLIRGIALQELGRTGEAIASIEKAIQTGYREDLANAYLLIAYFRANDLT